MVEIILSDPLFYIGSALTLLITGAIAGVLAGLLGVGGGIVVVPVLFFLFPLLGVNDAMLMHLVVGTSLGAMIPTTIASTRSHYKRGGVDVPLLKSLAPSVFLGVVAGAVLGGQVKGEVLTLIFAIVAILVAINMTFRRDGDALAGSFPGGIVRQALGMTIGGFSVVMGIGGGTLTVPTLTSFNYPIRTAIGTAAAIGLIIAIPGSVVFIVSGFGKVELPVGSLGYANLIGITLIAPATILTVPLGVRLTHTLNPNYIRKAFALFLLLTSMRMFYSALVG